jgi:DNA repair exonuclease SbcCD ATPase subunit
LSAHGETRNRAFQAACQIAASGRRPTLSSVREALDGLGGQQAIQQGLNDWIDESARRFQMPAIPAELQGPTMAFWENACNVAEKRWDTHKSKLDARIADLDQQVAALTLERDQECAAHAATRERESSVNDERDALAAMLLDTRAAIEELDSRLQEITHERETLRAELENANAFAEEQARAVDYAQRVAGEAREAHSRAQERAATLLSERDVARSNEELMREAADAANAETERVRSEAKTSIAQALADREADRAQISTLHGFLAERDTQLAALAKTLQGQQEARDADTQHWMARIEELRAWRDEAKRRETEWVADKKRLVAEIGDLRSALRKAQRNKPADERK